MDSQAACTRYGRLADIWPTVTLIHSSEARAFDRAEWRLSARLALLKRRAAPGARSTVWREKCRGMYAGEPRLACLYSLCIRTVRRPSDMIRQGKLNGVLHCGRLAQHGRVPGAPNRAEPQRRGEIRGDVCSSVLPRIAHPGSSQRRHQYTRNLARTTRGLKHHGPPACLTRSRLNRQKQRRA